MTLNFGTEASTKEFLGMIAKETVPPKAVIVRDFSIGIVNEGQSNQKPWANLVGVDTELLKQFKSINQEQFCPLLKIKLKNYKGEDLTSLVGAEIIFSDFDISFVYDKFKQPIGLALVVELDSISVV